MLVRVRVCFVLTARGTVSRGAQAAGENLKMLLASLEPLLDAVGVSQLRRIATAHQHVSDEALHAMWARKLGLAASGAEGAVAAAALWRELDQLLRAHPTDWTIFWRQLAEVPVPSLEPLPCFALLKSLR